ncbi:hypothetical protein [Metabacillus sp. Hm71]|uniref:hypothetical protein n=1 Tax=Metabacillus sp. Hm71 TaxID=3450743 RepID=UPI003F42684D
MKKIYIDNETKTIVIEDQHSCFEIPFKGEVSELLHNPEVIKLLNLIDINGNLPQEMLSA